MNGDEAAFLRAIAAAPDDDLPRLVYADWLDERGDPRGEYIRAAIEVARWGTPALAARARTLLAEHGAKWRFPHPFERQAFRRGFVEALTVGDGQCQYLSAIDPTTSVVRELVFWNELDDSDVAHVAASGFGRRVTRLTLVDPNGQIGSLLRDACPGLRHLTMSREFGCGKLSDIDFRYGPTGDEVAEEVASVAALTGLETLELVGYRDESPVTRVHATGAAAIARSPYLTNLKCLTLAHNSLGDGGLMSLAMSGNCASLDLLFLTDNGIGASGDAAIERLCTPPYFDGLRRLDLQLNPLSDAACRMLCRRFGDVLRF